MIESKSVLITGGAGFIGSHLAENMLADGYRVVVLDDLSTGSLRNIHHLIDKPGFKFQLGSVLAPRLPWSACALRHSAGRTA